MLNHKKDVSEDTSKSYSMSIVAKLSFNYLSLRMISLTNRIDHYV